MKALLIAILFLTFEKSFARVVIEESFWIPLSNKDALTILKSRPEFTIDHLSDEGFELYGPKGLELFLQTNHIDYKPLGNISIETKNNYPSFEEIESELKSIAQTYPDIAKLYSIGKSVKNRDLWVMKLSKNVLVDDSRPEFKYVANMHGDEIVGRELMLRFIKDCVTNYGTNQRITNLLDKFQIHILVSMNPDGAELGTRANAKKIDLNRDFPDFSTFDHYDTPDNRAPETQAVMNWQAKRKFKLSANFHGGAEVVNYPWDTVPERFPEESLIKNLSLEYATSASYIAASTVFKNGITNGYRWYEIDGGMQDWSIYWRGDFQITIELSNNKWPDYSMIDYYYKMNKPALLAFIERLENLNRQKK